MVALYTVQGLLLLLLSVEDWRTKRVSLLPLLALTMATLGGLFFLDQDINYAMVGAILGGLVALKAVVFLSSGKPLMGNGDLILLFPLLLSHDKSVHIFNRNVEFFTEEIAETGSIQNTSHTNNFIMGKACDFSHHIYHGIKGVCDHNDKGVRSIFANTSANLLNNFGVDFDKVVAAHTWLARHTGCHNHNIRPSDILVIIGQNGVEKVVEMTLLPEEQAAFDHSVAAVRELTGVVSKFVSAA